MNFNFTSFISYFMLEYDCEAEMLDKRIKTKKKILYKFKYWKTVEIDNPTQRTSKSCHL